MKKRNPHAKTGRPRTGGRPQQRKFTSEKPPVGEAAPVDEFRPQRGPTHSLKSRGPLRRAPVRQFGGKTPRRSEDLSASESLKLDAEIRAAEVPDFIDDAPRPMVAVVGRPNVGKSALFNRLAGKNLAIVHDRPGVTRDRLVAQCRKGVAWFDIMDTGGIGANVDQDFGAQVQAEAQIAIKVADLILFVVDGFEGPTPVDQELAETLRRTHKPLILVVNKLDNERRRDIGAEFARFGFADMVETSAVHGIGAPELIALICRRLNLKAKSKPADSESHEENIGAPAVERKTGTRHPDAPLRLAIVGRPNAGKSSLINALIGAQRTIVSPIAGTTRDAVDIPFEMHGRKYLLIDTAGLRRKAKIHDTVEVFSTNSATRSIKRADICILMVDCAEGPKMQDRKIAQLIVEHRRPCILVMNKFDLFHPNGKMSARKEELSEWANREFFFMRHAPQIPVSAKNSQNLDKIFSAVERIRDGAQKAPGTGVLNRILQAAIARSLEPIGTSGKSFKLLYATIAKNDFKDAVPVPEFVLFGNRVDKLQDSYLRYLEDQIRQEWSAEGLPFHFTIRGKEKMKDRAKNR